MKMKIVNMRKCGCKGCYYNKVDIKQPDKKIKNVYTDTDSLKINL